MTVRKGFLVLKLINPSTVLSAPKPAQVSILVPGPLKVVLGDRVEIPVKVSGVPTPEILWDSPSDQVTDYLKFNYPKS